MSRIKNIDTNSIKEVSKFMVFIIGFTTLLLLFGCTSQPINSNTYYQNNYGEECLYEPYTNSYKNLLFCYQVNQVQEHKQNEITNKLAKGETK